MSMDHYGPASGPKGEQGMSERLTMERFAELCDDIWRQVATDMPMGYALWQAIEADREAVRAETREEFGSKFTGDREDLLEQLFWEFDAEHKKSGMERDAFKSKMRFFAGKFAERAREEILRDHFKIGERVQVCADVPRDEWIECKVVARVESDRAECFATISVTEHIRRPAKKRPMTDDELRLAFKASERSAQYVADRLKSSTIRDIMEAHGLPTEVEE